MADHYEWVAGVCVVMNVLFNSSVSYRRTTDAERCDRRKQVAF